MWQIILGRAITVSVLIIRWIAAQCSGGFRLDTIRQRSGA